MRQASVVLDGMSFVLSGTHASLADWDSRVEVVLVRSIVFDAVGGFSVPVTETRRGIGSGFGLRAIFLSRNVAVGGCRSFFDRRWLTSASIETGCQMRRIESAAFSCCGSLKCIRIPQNVSVICPECFSYSFSLSSISFDDNSRLERIDSGAFWGCGSLKSIIIPRNVYMIGPRCFGACRFLQSVLFEKESRLQRIETDAFSECQNLQSITFPRSLSFLGGHAIGLMNDISIESNNRFLKIHEQFIVSCDGTQLVAFFGRDEVVRIPGNIEVICSKCFYRCQCIKSLLIDSPSTLKAIESEAFSHCSVRSICIPRSVESLGDGCFRDSGVAHVGLENGSELRRIGDSCFRRCRSLKSIHIPRKVKMIGDGAFCGSCINSITKESGNFRFLSTGSSIIDLLGGVVQRSGRSFGFGWMLIIVASGFPFLGLIGSESIVHRLVISNIFRVFWFVLMHLVVGGPSLRKLLQVGEFARDCVEIVGRYFTSEVGPLSLWSLLEMGFTILCWWNNEVFAQLIAEFIWLLGCLVANSK
jgi:hypothetical protein